MSRTTEDCGCKHNDGRWLHICPACYTALLAHREALRATGYNMPAGNAGLPNKPLGAAEGLI